MTTAVLKNRLLQMTQRRFSVEALGFSSLQALLGEFPAIVRLDHTTSPTTVEFLGEATPAPKWPASSSQRTRVRDDLWNAMLNYTAGHAWVWDEPAERARPALDSDDEAVVMPTIQQQELAELRAEFSDRYAESAPEEEKLRLARWSKEGLGTAELPPPLRSDWNALVKRTVLDRLKSWFEAEGIELPNDLLVAEATSAGQPADEELVRLRSLVIDCVRMMTLSELASLTLPAGAVFRSRQRRSGSYGA